MVRADWSDHLRDTAGGAGTAAAPDAGIPPHALLFLGRDALLPLATALAAADLVPTTITQRLASAPRDATPFPVELRIAVAFDAVALTQIDGAPAARIRLALLDSRSSITLRTPRVDVELPLGGSIEITAPLRLDGDALWVRFADSVFATPEIDPVLADGPFDLRSDEAWVAPWVLASVRDAFQSIPSRVELLAFSDLSVGRDRLPLRASAFSVDGDHLRIEFITGLRPRGAFHPVLGTLPPDGVVWAVHPDAVRADVAGLLLDGRVSRLGVESDRFARLGLRELRFSPGLRADIRLRQWDTEGPACGSVDLVHSRPLPVEVRRGRLGDAPSTSNAYRTEAEVFSPDPVDEALVASLFSGIARRARLWLGGPTLRATDGSLLTFEGARFVTSPEALLAVGTLVHEARSWR